MRFGAAPLQSLAWPMSAMCFEQGEAFLSHRQEESKTCDFVAGNSGKAETRGQRKCKKLQLHIDMEHNSDKVATAICSEKKYQNN